MSNQFHAQFAITPSQMKEVLNTMRLTKLSSFIWGAPGIGKSAIIMQLAQELGYEFIDIRLSQIDPTDLRGIPMPVDVTDADGKVSKQVKWSVPSVFPTDPDAKAILFLDEFNSAPPSVLAASYQLILDRKLGEYSLPEGVIVVAAGNRNTDNGITFRMPRPILNRFVHYEMKHDFTDWQEHAMENSWDATVVGYVSAFKDKLFDDKVGSDARGFRTPRSWGAVSAILKANEIKPVAPSMLRAMIYGAIGEEATQFLTHREMAMAIPSTDDILNGKIKEVKELKESSKTAICYSLTTSLGYILRDEYLATKHGKDKDEIAKLETAWAKRADNFLDFVDNSMATEITVMSVQAALKVFKIPFAHSKITRFEHFVSKYSNLITGKPSR